MGVENDELEEEEMEDDVVCCCCCYCCPERSEEYAERAHVYQICFS